nr:hypothetical protein [Tanacetum cinerariifolium]
MMVSRFTEIVQIVDHTIVDEVKEHVGKKKKKRVIFEELLAKRLRADAAMASEDVSSTGGKSPAALKRLELQSETQGAGSGSALSATEEFVSSSVTPTPEPNAPEDSGSTYDGGVWTHQASMGVVVSSSSRDDDGVAPTMVEDALAASAGRVGVLGDNAEVSTSMPDFVSHIDDFYDSQTVETATADNIYVPGWGVTNGARVDNPSLCRNLLDHVTPPAYWAILHNLSHAAFLDDLGDDCERLRKEVVAEAKLKEELKYFQDVEALRFEQNSAELDARIADSIEYQSALGKVITFPVNKGIQKGVEAGIKHGKSGRTLAQVEAYDPWVKDDFVSAVTDFENVSFGLLDEVESLKDSPLASIMSALVLKDPKMEVGVAVKSQEVETLGKQNAELLSKVSILESEHGELNKHVIKLGDDCERLRKEVVAEAKLKEELKYFQDVEALRFEQNSAELDARIADSIEYQSALGKVITFPVNKGIQKGVEAGIKHGKSGRTLAQVEAYDPWVKDDFVSAVTDFENVSFGLLDEVESLKDSPLASIMSALVLKDPK